jgi:uncharacterized protein YegL
MKNIFYFLVIVLAFVSCELRINNGNTKLVVQEIPLTYDDASGQIDLRTNFYFIFDQSGSMRESCSGKEKIEGAKSSINKFIGNIPEDVNIALMVVGCDNNTEIAELLPLALATPEQKKKFSDQIATLKPTGGTPLVGAIKIATDKMVAQKKKQLGYGEYRIVVVSDGEATDADLDDAAIYATQYTIGIYSIGLCMNSSHPLKEFSVKYYDANDYDQLNKALESVTSETEMFDVANYDSTSYSQ